MTTESIVIQPRANGLSIAPDIRELWRFRHLIRTLVERDLRSRYKNSVLGIGWTMINPLIQVLVLTITVKYILNYGPNNMSAYIFCATLPWTFFQASVLDSSTAVLGKIGLLKKVYFPREIPLISNVCQNFTQFLIALSVFVLYRYVIAPIFIGWPGWPPREILWLPVVILVLFLLTLGVSFFMCTWNVFYEDVKFIGTIVMGFLFYLLPIIYFAENLVSSPALMRIPGQFLHHSVAWWAYHLYLVNPVAWIVTAFKQMFFGPTIISSPNAPPVFSAPFDWRYLLITTVISLGFCLWGYAFFNSRKWKFTERP